MIKTATNYLNRPFERTGSSHIIRMISQANSFMHSWVSPTNNVDSIIVNILDQSYVTLLSQVCYLCHPCGGWACKSDDNVWNCMIIYDAVKYELVERLKLNAGSSLVSKKIDFRISFNVYVNLNLYNLHFVFDMITCCWNLNF